MWLLNTKRAEPEYFVSPEDAPPFAILSHTWSQDRSKPEQTFQEVQAIRKRCAKRFSRKIPRNLVCEKIKRCCEVAEADGYEWVWIDTCCIDKTSSAELSEAINSMFRYYALSRVCYVYLEGWDGDESTLCRRPYHRWFSRGWTLQELIAPNFVLFLDSTWRSRGSKVDLANTIGKITSIPSKLLRLERSLSDYNVVTRMHWAALRQTTREEDEAYCLLGIFGINMPTLYGEGRHAFFRLQEELFRQQPDPTLFCCGSIYSWAYYCEARHSSSLRTGFLLADRPSEFIVSDNGSQRVSHNVPAGMNESTRPFTLNMTPYGLEAHIPLAQLEGRISLADFGYRLCDGGQALYIPLLQAEHSSPRAGRRPLTHVALVAGGRILICTTPDESARLDWDPPRDVLIAYKPPPLTSHLPKPIPGLKFAYATRSPFRFDPKELVATRMTDTPYGSVELKTHLVSVSAPHATRPWCYEDEQLPIHLQSVRLEMLTNAMVWKDTVRIGYSIQFGLCGVHLDGNPQAQSHGPKPQVHWARVDETESLTKSISAKRGNSHDCGQDHISEWDSSSSAFKVLTKSHITVYVSLRFRSVRGLEGTHTMWMEPPTLILQSPGSAPAKVGGVYG